MCKKFGLLALLVLPAMSVSAIPFDNTTVSGTATVGTGGDYTTLKEAADAFNAVASPFIQGDWKLEILEDLTEPANVGFGNTIPAGNTLTLKPAADVTPTITFTKTTDNGGASGHLMIGSNDLSGWILSPMDNFIIDGSNNGTDSRDLTITNSGVMYSWNGMVTLVGEVNNITIKNTNIINNGGGAGTLTNIAGLSVVLRRQDGVANRPDGFQFLNNLIQVKQTQGHGILMRASGTAIAGETGMTGWLIEGNTIQATLRGIQGNIGFEGTIRGNVIEQGKISPINGYAQYGIYWYGALNQTGKELLIADNQIFLQSANIYAGAYGCFGIAIESAGTGNTANIINNMMNFRYTSSATANGRNMRYLGMRFTSGITYNIYHNSINMPDFANLDALKPNTALDTANCAAIKFPPTVGYTANVKNNIFRVMQKGVPAIDISKSAGTPTLNFDNNDYVIDTAAFYGASGNITTHADLAAWQAAVGGEANAFTVDPTTTADAAWSVDASTADLHFVPANAKPVGLPGIPAIAGVDTDIDGDPRNIGANAGGVYPGADEGIVALPVSLSGFSIE